MRFWTGITGIALAFAWRTILAILLSFPAGLILIGALFFLSADYMRSHGNTWFTKAHSPLFFIAGLSWPLWILGGFSMMRFGANHLTQLNLLAALLASSAEWLVTMESGTVWFVFTGMVFLAYALCDAYRRIALLILAIVFGVTWVSTDLVNDFSVCATFTYLIHFSLCFSSSMCLYCNHW